VEALGVLDGLHELLLRVLEALVRVRVRIRVRARVSCFCVCSRL
jgi:hypothetical protein